MDEFPASTREVKVPLNPVDQVIGQDEAISIAKVAATQRRNLLLVGPPGIGKSMIAQAMASLLPIPRYEIAVLDNLENPEKPILEVLPREQVEIRERSIGVRIKPLDAPVFVAERLGYRCRRCGALGKPNAPVCGECGADKWKTKASPFDDIFSDVRMREDRTYASRVVGNTQERIMYERDFNGDIIFYDGPALAALEARSMGRKVIIPIDRNTFVQATGASETELLGDVKHDPYGGHPEIGVKPYKRVIPGAVHEAHEGVLFIDEISSLGRLQRSILTAMQDKKFAIIGRNATSSGASVKVDGVPCDFILVAALNFGDMETILPPLRSRILGNGYEVLLNTLMPDTPQNVKKIVQFIAQEIVKDGRIPHADRTAIARILEETRRRAKELDGKTGLTLRLRNLSGVIKLAGDMTILENSKIITKKHVEMAIEKAKTIEQQAQGRYGSLWRTTSSDYSTKPAEDYTI